MAKFEQLPVSALKIDERIYPRSQIDRFLVYRYSDVLQTGTRLDEARDPIRAWRRNGDYVILDGAHRCEAYRQVFGPDHTIKVLVHAEEEFANEAEAALAALRFNSQHGKPVAPYDVALIYARFREHGITIEQVADAANMTVARVERILERRLALGPLELSVETRSFVPLKRPAIHLAGAQLTGDQVDYQRKAVGLAQLRLIKEVIRLIDTRTIDLSNRDVMAALRALHRKLTVLLAETDT